MHIDEVFEQTHKLPTVPRVVQELIGSFGQEALNVSELADRIALDQVITAKLLRLANSAHFGASRKIGSVHEAIIVLGFNTVRTLVVAAGVTSAFVATPGFDRARFWRHALSVALAARALAQHVGDNREIAFTSGLLHSIGELLLRVVQPELAARIDRSVAGGSDRLQLETSNFGFTHLELGAELARRWNFPDAIQLAIAEQCSPQPCTRLSAVLQLALAAVAAEGGPVSWPEPALAVLALPATELDTLLPSLQTHDPELENLLL